MKRELGVAYCGLVCALCSENENCCGCQKKGCKDQSGCKNFDCCSKEHRKGCYECPSFPCKGSMLDNPRIYAFSKFCGMYKEAKLLDCLERNETAGIHYHTQGLIGDYDDLSEEAVFALLLTGRKETVPN